MALVKVVDQSQNGFFALAKEILVILQLIFCEWVTRNYVGDGSHNFDGLLVSTLSNLQWKRY